MATWGDQGEEAAWARGELERIGEQIENLECEHRIQRPNPLDLGKQLVNFLVS
jgi:hypothetical protein